MELLIEWKQLFGLILLLLITVITINFVKRKIKNLKQWKKYYYYYLSLSRSSLDAFKVSPNVSVKNDINLTINGENLDGIQGEWIITSEEKKEKGKEIIVITIEKNEIN